MSAGPRIIVCVRKRPINKKEHANGDHDTIEGTGPGSLVVLEPRVKVDLRKYTEKWPFTFDLFLDDRVTNVDVYNLAVSDLLDTALSGGNATCFAYGQTGSGKTHTMMGSGSEKGSGVYLMAAKDLFARLDQGQYIVQASLFEIYAGKLYDLLNKRKKIHAMADAKDNVVISGLSERTVNDPDRLMALIEKGAAERASGSTAANTDSSRSHGILQLSIKTRDREKPFGKLAFIDLAGSERGADTAHCDRQTRMEGADINKSLLALKECIRALALGSKHIPFRGSKLTSVLKDSFTGRSRAVMIACVSPASSNCEHSLNTLRYAYRVKELKEPGSGPDPNPPPPKPVAPPPPKPQAPLQPMYAQPPPMPYDQGDGYSAGFDAGPPAAAPKPRSKPKRKAQSRPQWNENWNDGEGKWNAEPVEAPQAAMRVKPEGQRVAQRPEHRMLGPVPYVAPSSAPVDELEENDEEEDEEEEDDDPEVRRLQEEHTKLMDCILEEEDDMVDFQRTHIDQKMELVKKELEAMELLDRGKCGVDEYVTHMDAILAQQIQLLHEARERLQQFQNHLLEEEILNTTVIKRTMNKKR